MNKTDEELNLAEAMAKRYGVRMCDENGDTHGEELYCVGIDDIADIIREALAEHPMDYDQGFVDGVEAQLAEPVKQEPMAYTNKEQVNELIKESARLISSIKDEGDQYLTAIDALRNAYRIGLKDSPVDAKAIRAEALEQAEEIAKTIGGSFSVEFLAAIRGLK